MLREGGNLHDDLNDVHILASKSFFFFFEGAAVYVRETEKEREGTFVCVNARMLVPLCMRERESKRCELMYARAYLC